MSDKRYVMPKPAPKEEVHLDLPHKAESHKAESHEGGGPFLGLKSIEAKLDAILEALGIAQEETA